MCFAITGSVLKKTVKNCTKWCYSEYMLQFCYLMQQCILMAGGYVKMKFLLTTMQYWNVCYDKISNIYVKTNLLIFCSNCVKNTKQWQTRSQLIIPTLLNHRWKDQHKAVNSNKLWLEDEISIYHVQHVTLTAFSNKTKIPIYIFEHNKHQLLDLQHHKI